MYNHVARLSSLYYNIKLIVPREFLYLLFLSILQDYFSFFLLFFFLLLYFYFFLFFFMKGIFLMTFSWTMLGTINSIFMQYKIYNTQCTRTFQIVLKRIRDTVRWISTTQMNEKNFIIVIVLLLFFFFFFFLFLFLSFPLPFLDPSSRRMKEKGIGHCGTLN